MRRAEREADDKISAKIAAIVTAMPALLGLPN
jgi:hypothetical protein